MESPLILWNHRWEYDKNPASFFQMLFDLKNEGYAFEVCILGESYNKTPSIFGEAKEVLKQEVVHFGYAEDKNEYRDWLVKCDIIPVTSNQDFFGESLIEAMAYNCYPLVPNRLAFPEHFPPDLVERYLYNSDGELLKKMRWLLENPAEINVHSSRQLVEKYFWNRIIDTYDDEFTKLVDNFST